MPKSIFAIAGTIVAGAALSACWCAITCPSPCTADVSRRAQSVTVILPSGAPLARFEFTQTVTVNIGDNCPADPPQGTIALAISSSMSETVSFAYAITALGDHGETAWTYAGNVSGLAEGATLNVGTIANSVIPMDVGIGPHIKVSAVSSP